MRAPISTASCRVSTSMARTKSRIFWDAVASLKLTIVCLVCLMVLVVACTLAQVRMGTFGAVNAYIRSALVWWHVPDTGVQLPVFPGGLTVGVVLLANLVVAQSRRLELSWRKSGLWLVHAGLILLFVGEFVSGARQVEMQLSIEQGQTLGFLESPRDLELAITDVTDPTRDEVHGIPEALLSGEKSIPVAGTPLVLRIQRYYQNADLSTRAESDPISLATAGVGTSISARELPPVSRDDDRDLRAVYIEPIAAGRSYGTWLVSNGLGAPQSFIHEGRKYTMSLRARREYLPYALTLKKFSHDIYPGTDIPKNFSSLVHLSNPAHGEERDVLISMNQPLRYAGRAFYQSSFGKNDTLSVLQVVENPGWLLPYVSCVLVAAGLVLHFALTLGRSLRRRQAAVAVAVAV